MTTLEPGPDRAVDYVAAVSIVHCHQRVEETRSREKARDEPTIGRVVDMQALHLPVPHWGHFDNMRMYCALRESDFFVDVERKSEDRISMIASVREAAGIVG